MVHNRFVIVILKLNLKRVSISLILSQCPVDGLLQLGKPWPANQVRPKLEWISYIEPEAHLDDMTDRIIQMKGVTKESFIVGLSYKDEPVLSRFEVKGYKNTHNIHLSELGIESGSGMETIQKVLSPNLALKLKEDVGIPKVIIVRHLLEHSESISRTLSTLSTWGDENSYFIFEVPDSEQTFQNSITEHFGKSMFVILLKIPLPKHLSHMGLH